MRKVRGDVSQQVAQQAVHFYRFFGVTHEVGSEYHFVLVVAFFVHQMVGRILDGDIYAVADVFQTVGGVAQIGLRNTVVRVQGPVVMYPIGGALLFLPPVHQTAHGLILRCGFFDRRPLSPGVSCQYGQTEC